MLKVPRRGAAALLAGLPLLAGCVAVESQWLETMGPLTNPSADIQFQDVPVPFGMRLRSTLNESYSFEAGSFRYGHFVYEGGLRLPEVAGYLLERLPLHGWRLEADEQPNQDQRLLRFRHLDQVATCQVERTAGGTTLVINVSTRRQRT